MAVLDARAAADSAQQPGSTRSEIGTLPVRSVITFFRNSFEAALRW